MLDGSPGPEDVYEVVVTPGEHTYLFSLSEEMLNAPTETVVPEATVTISEDEQRLTVTMECAVAADSVPAVLRVTEDPFEINVTPVVVGPSFGAPCEPGAVVGTITVALEDPVGVRRIVITRAGVAVPLAGFG